jgi:hypothetical protein
LGKKGPPPPPPRHSMVSTTTMPILLPMDDTKAPTYAYERLELNITSTYKDIYIQRIMYNVPIMFISSETYFFKSHLHTYKHL